MRVNNMGPTHFEPRIWAHHSRLATTFHKLSNANGRNAPSPAKLHRNSSKFWSGSSTHPVLTFGRKHVARHERPHLCDKYPPCDSRFSTSNDLDRHKVTVHDERIPG